MRSFAFTLVELLIALALSLLLLLAVTELLGRVGGAMNDARTAMSASADLHAAAILLRQDLARIPNSLATKPARIVDPSGDIVSDSDGYLEIIEGPYAIGIGNHPFVDADGNPDDTVGDVDDIIAFTARALRGGVRVSAPFRGLIVDEDGELRVVETEDAEIVWFVRGNTLYRRVRLITDTDSPVSARADRRNRLLHTFGSNPGTSLTNSFPYPLYCPDHPGWRFLRVPTLEETLHEDWRGIPQWKTIEVPTTPRIQRPTFGSNRTFSPTCKTGGAVRCWSLLAIPPATSERVRMLY